MKLLKKVNYILSSKQKSRLLLLSFIILVGTFLELLGVSAILPFINIILNPGNIFLNKYSNMVYHLFNMTSTNQFILLFSVALIVIYIVKNIYVAVMYDLQYRFTYNNQRRLSSNLLNAYMRQPYLFHLSHNSAELMRNISVDADMFFRTIFGFLQLLTEICVCTVLVIFLMFMDKSITIGVTLLLGIFILVFYRGFKKNLSAIAEKSRTFQMNTTKWLQQSFGGTKEIKVLGRENFFINSYDENYKGYADCQRKYLFLQILPRPVMEAMCVTGLLLVVSIKLYIGVSGTYFISALSVFAIAAFRMLPSFNRITNSMSIIMFNKIGIDAVYHDLKEVEELQNKMDEEKKNRISMKLNKKIEIQDLSFRYPDLERYVLKDVNLEIPSKSSVAFVGPSGAGKTTLADIILAILEPESGKVLVDDIDIFENVESWHKNIGYIPQSIYLMDDTIRNNIAFGLPEKEINEESIRNSLADAQLDTFVNSLPDGLDTVIGERGIRLSGGQRQRIGIARALYMNPDVLVLDEATSALDNDTEEAVMEAIDNLKGNKTLIIIAHRLSTIKNCELVYEVKNGQVMLK